MSELRILLAILYNVLYNNYRSPFASRGSFASAPPTGAPSDRVSGWLIQHMGILMLLGTLNSWRQYLSTCWISTGSCVKCLRLYSPWLSRETYLKNWIRPWTTEPGWRLGDVYVAVRCDGTTLPLAKGRAMHILLICYRPILHKRKIAFLPECLQVLTR